ncbi:MAG TPA: hypothetical protein VI320_33005 [Terracidiphilus sp.]
MTFALGRERSREQAEAGPLKPLSVVQVDSPVGPEILEAPAKIPNLLQVRLVHLG